MPGNQTIADPEALRQDEPKSAPAGEGDYVVRPDNCISSISEAHGFFWNTLWKLPENAELRRTRDDPNLLLAGDRVTIPDLREGADDCATEKCHRFRRKGVPTKLRIRFEEEGEPRTGEVYSRRVDHRLLSGVLDADGMLDVPIPAGAQLAVISIGDEEPLVVTLGIMDPIDSWSGILPHTPHHTRTT